MSHGTLTKELAERAEKLADFARREELDFYPVLFELLNFEEISQVAAYSGFPQRYPHCAKLPPALIKSIRKLKISAPGGFILS